MAKFQTRLTPEMIETYTRSGDWGTETFLDILDRRAADHPDREVLYDRRQRVTYGELREKVDRLAARLQELGVGPGEVVTIQLPNWVEFACAFFAVERIGGIANQISTDFRSSEVEFIMGFSESVAYVCAENFRGFDYLPMVAELRPRLPSLRHVCVVDGAGGEGVVSLKGVLDGSEPAGTLAPVKGDANAIYRMAFTSGTTGDPKAVTHSHNTTLSACRILNRDMKVTEDEVFLIYLPLGLNWGYLTLVQTVMAGARAVLLDRFTARDALELIAGEGATFIPTAPASVIAMLNDPDLAGFDLSSLRVVISGGASCPVETIREYRKKMKGAFLELYGMLETGFHTYTRFTDDPEAVSGSVGKVVDEMGLRLIDGNGDDVPEGAEGEIAGIGPCVHLGYHNNPAVNEAAFGTDGWFRTGDMGQYDAAGNLRIVGRNKEMINRGGKKFHPREIEEILYTHPKVLHAAMIGVPDPRVGEKSCLCVIPREGQSVSLDEFLAMLGDQVATYKLPESFEIFDEFPFTPTGKLQRHELARLVLERHGPRPPA